MAATVQINEYNGAGETGTNNISTGHFRRDNDSPNLSDPADDPIPVPGAGSNYSYEKWWKMDWVSGSAVKLDTLRIYKSAGTTPANTSFLTSADTTTPSNPTYTTPVNTASAVATFTMPTADPAVANISGTLTAAGQESSYVVCQMKVDVGAIEGDTSGQVTFAWREIA